ncbi:MAG: acyltransferase family protein [Cypionkella sp.]
MGILRFVLAFLVMLSHLSGTAYRINYGQTAVLSFYFISGWLMAMIYARFQQKSSHPTLDFFIDRAIKIWPSYLLVFFATVIFYYATGLMQPEPTDLFRQMFIFTNGYGKMFEWGYPMVLPSWSLGVELQFYLIVPLLALLTYRVKLILAFILAGGHLLALSSSRMLGEFIHCGAPFGRHLCEMTFSDYLGFDLPFLVVVTFLAGNIAYERFIVRKSSDPYLFVLWAVYAACLFFLFPYRGWIRNLSTNEALSSITLFLPICLAVLVMTKDAAPTRLDRFLGSLSYPLFLCHFLALYLVNYFLGDHSVNNRAILETIALALVLAVIIAAFQVQVVDRLRYRARGFGSSLPKRKAESGSAPSAAPQPAE